MHHPSQKHSTVPVGPPTPPTDTLQIHVPRSQPVEIPPSLAKNTSNTLFNNKSPNTEVVFGNVTTLPQTFTRKSPTSLISSQYNSPSAASSVASTVGTPLLEDAMLAKLNFDQLFPSPPNTVAIKPSPDSFLLKSHLPSASYSISREDRSVSYSIRDFSIMREIGAGGCAKVFVARRNKDGKLLAVKTMRRDVISSRGQIAHVRNEKLVAEMVHESPFVIHHLASFKDAARLYMVQEFLPGGDLFQYLKTNGKMDPEAAKFYGAQLHLAISYLHNLDILHRDIKPENIFLDFHGNMRLGDLGYAKQLAPGTTTGTFCGTPSYLAPEIIKQKRYGRGVDWWAYGVVTFQLSSAQSPFQDKAAPLTFSRILAGKIRWPSDPSTFSDDLRDLIDGLLRYSASKRYGQSEVRLHPWFAGTDWDAIQTLRMHPPTSVAKRIRRHVIDHDPMVHAVGAPLELSWIRPAVQPGMPDPFEDF